MLNNNKVNLLISIIAAIVIWAFVTMGVNPPKDESIKSVPVEILNLETLNDRGLTVDQTTTYTVDLSIRGPRTDVDRYSAADFKATVDLTGFPKGLNTVKVKVVAPTEIQVIQIMPANIAIEVVDLVSVTKPVKLLHEETFPKGKEPGFVSITPDEMEVSGTAEAVANIEYVGAEIPEGDLTEEKTNLTLAAFAVDKEGERVSNVNLSQETVEVEAILSSTKEVPLKVEVSGTPLEGVEISKIDIPKTIVVRGSSSALEKVTDVSAKTIDISGVTETVSIPIVPTLPDTIEIADASFGIAVKIEVRDLERKEFTYTAENIDVRGLPEGLSGHVNTGSVTVTIVASVEDIADIRQEDIKLFVDASQMTAAAEAVEMNIQYDTEKKLQSILAMPEKVRVTING